MAVRPLQEVRCTVHAKKRNPKEMVNGIHVIIGRNLNLKKRKELNYELQLYNQLKTHLTSVRIAITQLS